MADIGKVNENRVRRVAERRGYILRKSRRRDPLALNFGAFWLIEASTNGLAVGGEFGTDLQEIEDFLNSDAA